MVKNAVYHTQEVTDMAFTITFLKVFFIGILHILSILMLILFVIVALGLIIGRVEKWSTLNALYYKSKPERSR
jgi:hypothetical protein